MSLPPLRGRRAVVTGASDGIGLVVARRLELDRRSRAHGWGLTSNLAHPGVVPSSLLPALVAATAPDGARGLPVGPGGPGHLRGAPAEQPPYRSLRRTDDAERLWDLSQELTGVPFPTGALVPARPWAGAGV